MTGLPVHERIRRTAAVNGGGVAAVAGAFTLYAAFSDGWALAGFGALATLAGLMELNGRRLVAERPRAAGIWLQASQLWLFAVIAAYAIWRLAQPDLEPLRALLARSLHEYRPLLERLYPGTLPLLERLIAENHPLLQELLLTSYRYTYGALIAVSIFYQGGMWWYYRRRLRELTGA
ncbi:MAG TPA: hypothetical protein VNL72_00585 [Gammaproteobacteria bacterium]|nr:hypothetical protein [Gammaproteobacteria bacterium]